MTEVPGTVVLRGVVGSTAYGLAHAESDVDRLGAFVLPTRKVLSMHGPTAVEKSFVTHEPVDQAYHEVGKLLRLAMAGNPTVLELFWLTEYEVCTEDGEALVAVRGSLLSTKRVRAAYGGYAHQQARKLQSRAAEGKTGFAADLGKRTAKHARHCMRLMLQGTQLMQTGELTLMLTPLQAANVTAAGQLAETDIDGFMRVFEETKRDFDAVESVLPDQPHGSVVNDTLVKMRLRHL